MAIVSLRQLTGNKAPGPVEDGWAREYELVRLIHWEGFNLSEAADVLDRPASTVRNEYARAKAQLRAILGEPTTSEMTAGHA